MDKENILVALVQNITGLGQLILSGVFNRITFGNSVHWTLLYLKPRCSALAERVHCT
ncbi:hypothetical protein ACPUYX_10450 [Desulfosporosinus sp. SYSU MS00001]|uniref:hypothetical protein n=1 Tax=Desulfosporosinus sp. SYSU MS00001 TaxID=3416284 RepID=UPI003CEDE8C7